MSNKCPDGGACHHKCEGDYCFRVQHCLPLTVYGRDDWTPEHRLRHGKRPLTYRALTRMLEQLLDVASHKSVKDPAHPIVEYVAQLADQALAYELDKVGIESREKDAIELVELRAEVTRLRATLKKVLNS